MDDTQTTLGGDGGTAASSAAPTDFLAGLPDDLKNNAALAPFKGNPASLAKAYIDTKAMVGSRVAIPKEGEADYDKKVGDIFAKLGRPEAPDQYGVEAPEGFDKKAVSNFLERAHKVHMTKAQVAATMDFYKEFIGGQRANLDERNNTAIADMQKKYGDKFEAVSSTAARAFKHYVPKEVADLTLADGTKIGNHPAMVEAFHKIATAMGEDKFTQGANGGMGGIATIRDELNKLTSDRKGPYWDAQNPGHNDAVQKALALRQQIADTLSAQSA